MAKRKPRPKNKLRFENKPSQAFHAKKLTFCFEESKRIREFANGESMLIFKKINFKEDKNMYIRIKKEKSKDTLPVTLY